LLYYHHLLRLHHLDFYLLLLGSLQVSLLLGLLAHALHRLHHVLLLRKKGVSKVGGPLDVLREVLHYLRKPCHGLDAGVPVLFLHGVSQGLILQSLVLL